MGTRDIMFLINTNQDNNQISFSKSDKGMRRSRRLIKDGQHMQRRIKQPVKPYKISKPTRTKRKSEVEVASTRKVKFEQGNDDEKLPTHPKKRLTEAENSLDKTQVMPNEVYPTKHCCECGYFLGTIRVYQCSPDVHPERVAFALSKFELLRDIADILVQEPNKGIPKTAKYIIIAEHIIYSPSGSVIFFAEKNEKEEYKLRHGFYFGYDKSDVNNIYSLAEWADMQCAAGIPLMEQYERVPHGRQNTQGRHDYLWELVARAVDQEMEKRLTRPSFNSRLRANQIYRVRASVA